MSDPDLLAHLEEVKEVSVTIRLSGSSWAAIIAGLRNAEFKIWTHSKLEAGTTHGKVCKLEILEVKKVQDESF